MKIVILNSSPNVEKGNTHVMVESFKHGAESAGAEVENIFLAKYEIKPCTACFSCWFKTPGKCVLNDDAEMILDKMSKANLIVFATPLYVDNVSGIMKNLMDRMISTGRPELELDENNKTRHLTENKALKIGVISSCGFPEQDQFQVLRLLFKRIERNMTAELVVEIYRGEGTLLSTKNKDLKPILDNYKTLLEKAGKEVVIDGRLSKDTLELLEKPLIPYDVYNKAMNEHIKEKKLKLQEINHESGNNESKN